jgi:hypothetical protein
MSLLSIINSVLRCTIRYFRHETALFSARMHELHSYSIADALDGGAYGIPAPRCRVTYNVGHGDAWVSALGFAHRRAPAPPIRSIYRLRRSVHGVRYSSRRERRDCDRYCTTMCTGAVYHTQHPLSVPTVCRGVTRGGSHRSLFVLPVRRVSCGSCDVRAIDRHAHVLNTSVSTLSVLLMLLYAADRI